MKDGKSQNFVKKIFQTQLIKFSVVFVDKMGTMFLGGPPLVEAATGEKITAEELGGAMLHSSVSGCADYFAKDEVESSAYVRSIFETLNIPGKDN